MGFKKKAYIVGCEGIALELKLAGVQAYEEGGNPLPHNKMVFHEEEFAHPEKHIDPEVCCMGLHCFFSLLTQCCFFPKKTYILLLIRILDWCSFNWL